MVYTHKELKEKYGSDYQIQKAVKNGNLYKIESGVYSDKKSNHYLEIFTKKYPNAIISGDSAYYYHNLTDVIPKKIFMTTDRTSGRFNDKYIIQSYSTSDYFNLGKTSIEFEGIKINIYDKERMLIELIKNKNNTPYDYYKEIINNYRNIKDKLNIYKLQEYATVYSNGEKLMSIIQDEVF
jgi:predicted transcriptional regulator of viral defense system